MRKKIEVKYPQSNGSFTDAILRNRNMDRSELLRNMSSVEPPQNMKDAQKAADRIARAIKENESIALYTDYDADGFGCGIVFTELMRNLPYDKFFVFFNTRSMGFGMNCKGIDMILEQQPDTKLIVTSDNGIVAFDAVDYAKSKGIDVIITDHHMPDDSGKLPEAYAVVNPHRNDEVCEFRDFCGTGVLYKVLALVYFLLCKDTKVLNSVLDIVAVATIADVVPLRGENRIFAKIGLSKMSQECRPQWSAFKRLGSTYTPLVSFTSKDVGFFVGPCINASSRMNGDISKPMTAFLDTKEHLVDYAIDELTKINDIRKTIQKERTAEAMAQIAECDDRFILVQMHCCEEGVVGLVAGDICNTAYRPTIVLAKDENGNWKGSGRSIDGIHIKAMLDRVNKEDPSILLGYGGHSQACGLTVRSDKVDVLRKKLISICNEIYEKTPEVFTEHIIVDYVVDDITKLPRLYTEKVAMEPFGCEFPEPVVMVRFKPDETRILKNGKHLIFKYHGIDIISWNSGYKMNGRKPSEISEIIAIGTIEKGNQINCQHELLTLSFDEQ